MYTKTTQRIINLIKELELLINLSPEMDQSQKLEIQKQIQALTSNCF